MPPACKAGKRRLVPLGAAALVALLAAAPASAAPPQIGSPSGAVIETSTGTVLFAKDADERRSMASTTKLMTALVALDEAALGRRLTATDYGGSAAETRAGLVAGERMTVADLVRALLLPSANDAAHTLQIRLGGDRAGFARLMNRKAQELGLTETRFANAIGLDAPGHRTTALELAKIGVAAHEHPFVRGVVRQPRITLKTGARTRTLVNRNRVLGTALPGGGVIDGMKTGHTQRSGYALVGSATRDGVSIVSVVLGAASEAQRDRDTVTLLRWASGLMERRTLAEAGRPVTTVPVERGERDTVTLVPAAGLERVVPRQARIELRPDGVPAELSAPVRTGATAGRAQVLVNGRTVVTVPLQVRAGVERRGAITHLWHQAREHWQTSLFGLVLLLTGSLTLARALRGRPQSPRRASRSRSVPRDPAP